MPMSLAPAIGFRPQYVAGRAARVEQWRADRSDVFAYFDNDWHGNALLDATWLRDRLEPAASARFEPLEPALTSRRTVRG
jgi:uncharacterized protein YecE (DUF72 family)